MRWRPGSAFATARRCALDSYLALKLVHVLCAVVVAGTGAGIAFFMLMASRSASLEAIALTARHVVLADWLFTAPAVVLQFVSGVLLMERLGYSYASAWFLWVISLFCFVGLCWLPVVAIQCRLKALAESALASGRLDARFGPLMRAWTLLGIPAFAAVLAIFFLMVFKFMLVTIGNGGSHVQHCSRHSDACEQCRCKKYPGS